MNSTGELLTVLCAAELWMANGYAGRPMRAAPYYLSSKRLMTRSLPALLFDTSFSPKTNTYMAELRHLACYDGSGARIAFKAMAV